MSLSRFNKQCSQEKYMYRYPKSWIKLYSLQFQLLWTINYDSSQLDLKEGNHMQPIFSILLFSQQGIVYCFGEEFAYKLVLVFSAIFRLLHTNRSDICFCCKINILRLLWSLSVYLIDICNVTQYNNFDI